MGTYRSRTRLKASAVDFSVEKIVSYSQAGKERGSRGAMNVEDLLERSGSG